MAEVMYGLVSEARKNRFSAIPKLTEEDIVNVWDNVSKFIERQMALQKGVCVPGLGTFTYTQKKLDVGNNKYIQIQRPVFMLSEKFAMTHALNYTKHHTTGQIPVVQLNFAALSNETPFNRDTVESCVKEVLQALSRSVQAKRNVEFHFAGIGRLSIRESKVKMKFYKEFLRSMDGSGSLVHALSNRPGTADSVLSEPFSPRPHTSNTLVLPRITPGEGGSPGKSLGKEGMPTITEQDEELNGGEVAREEVPTPDKERPQEQEEAWPIPVVEPLLGEQDLPKDEDAYSKKPRPDAYNSMMSTFSRIYNLLEHPSKNHYKTKYSRYSAPVTNASDGTMGDDKPDKEGSCKALPKSPSRLSPANGPRTPLQPAKATGVIYNVSEPILTPPPTPPKSPLKAGPPKGIRGSTVNKVARSPTQDAIRREQSPGDHGRDTLQSPVSPSRLRCSHSDRAGQELCYLCHQRSQKNVPIYFAEERRQRELEEDRLLQQYQQQKDTEAILKEQTKNLNNRCYNQKVAAFNLGVSEAVKEKIGTRPTEFCRSYLFQNRPLTPPRYLKQDEYSRELGGQVLTKHDKLSKLKKEQEFLERLEQVQLAEDLALQREQYLREKKMGSDAYRKALDAQIEIRKTFTCSLRRPPEFLRLPKPQIIVPFSQTAELRLRGSPGGRMVRFKPLPIPALEPDSKAPIFGVLDATEEKLIDRKKRAQQLYQEQLEMVAQRKRDSILKDLQNQKEESDMLERTRRDIILDRALRHQECLDARRSLEDSWAANVCRKHELELEERRRAQSPGMLIHEQCDKYRRCKQCGRRPQNCGESNVWSESRYIPGSRLIV